MQFTREMQRLLLALLLAFAAIASAATYTAVLGPEWLLERDDNPRLVEERAAIQRGALYDRDERQLVYSELTPDTGRQQRVYLYPDLSSLLGYYSLRYGEGGAEAAYNGLLNGEDLIETLGTYFDEEILHRPRQGTDLRLTVDLEAQQALVNALEEQGCTLQVSLPEGDAASAQPVNGCAAVILSVPDGGVMAMVSTPGYDPNMLNANWDALVADPSQPFFNRALQGQYQPGTVAHVLMLTISLIEQVPLDRIFENATDVVRVGEVAQVCAESPPSESLTLGEAFIYGCAAPFARIFEQLGAEAITESFALFSFDAPPALRAFVNNVDANGTSTPEQTPELTAEAAGTLTLADAMGQGSVTVTPLEMAALVGAQINGGNALSPYVLLATRAPGTVLWENYRETRSTIPVTTPETSRLLQAIMRESVAQGTAHAAAREGYDIGGYAGLAVSGSQTQVWFVGWARISNREGVAIAVLIEGSEDLDAAAQVGGAALASAVDALGLSDQTAP